MPAYYPGGALGEHRHTRSGCSLFDLSHLGKYRIAGTGAVSALDRALTVPCAALETGECRCGFALNETGGVLGDVLVLRMADEDFFIVSAADLAPVWRERLPETLEVQDLSEPLAMLALCGPEAERTLRELVEETAARPGAYRHTMLALDDFRCITARVVFAGETEYRFFCRADAAPELWDFLLEAPGIRPAGMAARHSLRIEAGVPAFPDELNPAHTPLDCGLDIDLSRDFVGAAALRNAKPRRQLKLVKFAGRSAPLPGAAVAAPSGETVGRVTGGAFCPSAGAALAFCDLDAAFPAPEGAAVTSGALSGVVTAPLSNLRNQ